MVRRRSGTSWGCRDEVMECGEMPVINMLMNSFQLPQAQFQLLLLLILLE